MRDSNNRALYEAIIAGDVLTARDLISLGTDINYITSYQDKNSAVSSKNRSLLYIALDQNQREIVDLLLRASADTNIKTDDNHTILSKAILNNDKAMVQKLINYGANVDIKIADPSFKGQKTSLQLALHKNCNPEIIKLVLSESEAFTLQDIEDFKRKNIEECGSLSADTISSSAIDVIVSLVSQYHENNNNIFNKNKKTVLHYAAEVGEVRVMDKLLSRSPDDINVKDKDGKTPLHIAASKGKFEVIDFLIVKGADITIKDNKGFTFQYYRDLKEKKSQPKFEKSKRVEKSRIVASEWLVLPIPALASGITIITTELTLPFDYTILASVESLFIPAIFVGAFSAIKATHNKFSKELQKAVYQNIKAIENTD